MGIHDAERQAAPLLWRAGDKKKGERSLSLVNNTGGGGDFVRGLFRPGKIISEGGNFATLADPKAYTPKAHTASCAHCTAKAPRFRQEKFPPPSLQGKFLHCVCTAHAEAELLTQVMRLVVTVLFPRNPFQKNEQSKDI